MNTLSPMPGPCPKQPLGRIVRYSWQQERPAPHEFEVVAYPEEEGGYSVFAVNYPGVLSQGDTLEEAKANISEAFLAMLESQRKDNEKMEFSQSAWQEVPGNSVRFRVKVDG